jgi:alkylation response protein AidB-like acyl-CoA dehydrogenase
MTSKAVARRVFLGVVSSVSPGQQRPARAPLVPTSHSLRPTIECAVGHRPQGQQGSNGDRCPRRHTTPRARACPGIATRAHCICCLERLINCNSGEVGQGFTRMQLRLNVRRLPIGAWAIGLSRCALDMMSSHRQAEKDFRCAARRPADHPVVNRRQCREDPCLPSRGTRCGSEARLRRGRAPASFYGQNNCHRDGR